MSGTILLNSLLAIALMKSLTFKFTGISPEKQETYLGEQINRTKFAEQIIKLKLGIQNTKDGNNLPYLIAQHKLEILDVHTDLNMVLKKTFNEEFIQMLQTVAFVPFLHEKTPRPEKTPKSQEMILKEKYCWIPETDLLHSCFALLR